MERITDVIAVFDIGKTNKKLLLFNRSFKRLRQIEQRFDLVTDEDGFECGDVDRIEHWVKAQLLWLSTRKEYRLVGLNFTTFGASLALLDEQGKRVAPIYSYLKEVPAHLQEQLFEQYGGRAEFCRRTASPALGLLLNSGVQLLWLKHQKQELAAKVKNVLHFPQYLSYLYTGKLVSEPTSIGCHTFMWDFDAMQYHPWLAQEGFELPLAGTLGAVATVAINDTDVMVGAGIHDSSASLVPYLKGATDPFILVSTGTWCINMNPFNSEPLTANQLDNDCLCFMGPDRQQVKSSRLFAGHFHEVWVKRLAAHFGVGESAYKAIAYNELLVVHLLRDFVEPIYFPGGKAGFERGVEQLDLACFVDYEMAYTQLVLELTHLCAQAIGLVVAKDDVTQNIYITGGFSRNPIFVKHLATLFPAKQVFTSEIDNASALGAAMVLAPDVFGTNGQEVDLGLIYS